MKKKIKIISAILGVLLLSLVVFRVFILDSILSLGLEKVSKRTGLSLEYESVSLRPLNLTLNNVKLYFEGEKSPFAKSDTLVINFLEKTAAVDELRSLRPNVTVKARGKVHLRNYSFELELSMPPVRCTDFLQAFPRKLNSSVQTVKLNGKIAFDFHFNMDTQNKAHNFLDGEIANACTIKDFGAIALPAHFKKKFRHQVYDAQRKPYFINTGPGTKNWTTSQEMSPYIRHAAVEAEDPLFYSHSGVILSRIQIATRINIEKKTFRYGASTIPMQLAKNLFLSREKTIARKLQELFFVWYLESNFTKDEILTLYLNIAEFGPSIYGIKSASTHYFGCSPKELSLAQAAFLAKLLPAPTTRHIDKEKNRVSPTQARRIRALLHEMVINNRITQQEADTALSKRIVFGQPSVSSNDTPPRKEQPQKLSPVSPPTSHIQPAARPRLQRMPPPLSKIITNRKSRGSAL